MKHQDVVTFFHELGHAFHGLCSKVQFPKFAGTVRAASCLPIKACADFLSQAVARDFVEAPSQMLENWMYSHGILKSISKHYKTGESLDDATIESIIKSKSVNQGLFNLRQLFHGKFDSEPARGVSA